MGARPSYHGRRSGSGHDGVVRPWLDEMPADTLAEHLIGGIAILDVPRSERSAMLADAYSGTDFIIPPLPNTLFQRDPSCWIANGVTAIRCTGRRASPRRCYCAPFTNFTRVHAWRLHDLVGRL